MFSDEMENAFSDFLDGEAYDRAEEGLFAVVRLAFAAGWAEAKRDSERSAREQRQDA